MNESEDGQLSLAWEASCVNGNDYAVYEGDLDGQDCVSLGFESGVLTCEITCDGFDTQGCALCGNNRCEIFAGENCESCPSDCNGELHGNKDLRYCCGEGGIDYPVDCSDPRCFASGNTCAP